MLVCFLSVVGIALSKSDDATLNTYDPETRSTGIIICCVLAWVFAATCVFNRRLKDVNFAVVLFYHSIFGFTASALYIITEKLITGIPFRIYTGRQYGYLFLSCIFDWSSLALQTRAF